jgi:putative ABC transport system permease protein
MWLLPARSGALSALLARPWRALLSTLGVACGVFALVLLGSLAEHFDALANHFERVFAGRVYVCEKPTFWAGGGLIAAQKAARVEVAVARVLGPGGLCSSPARPPAAATSPEGSSEPSSEPSSEVSRSAGAAPPWEVIPLLVSRLESQRMVVVGVPQVLVGLPPAQCLRYLSPAGGTPIPSDGDRLLVRGRLLCNTDRGTANAVLGADVASTYRASPGRPVHVLGHDLAVVGVLAPTGALEDRQLLVSLDTAQRLLDREGLLTSLVVNLPPAQADTKHTEALAKAIRGQVGGLDALPPSRIAAQAASSLRLWHALTLGLGLLGVLTGSFGIVITMVVAVHERVREIGLKKALGASSAQVAGELVGEALALAAAGWVAGVAAAALFVWGWDDTLREEGLVLFVLHPPLLLRALIATLGLAAVAALGPALRAARMAPLEALRSR